MQQADVKAGYDLSKTTMAKLIGKGRDTIDAALDPTKCPKDAKTLKSIEAFLDKHFASNFSELGVALATQGIKKRPRTAVGPHRVGPHPMGPHHPWLLPRAVRRCAGGTAQVANVLNGDEAPAKRSRTNIPKLAAQFIDHYISRYASLQGDARDNVVTAVKAAMEAADPTWGLSLKVIDRRLDNEMKKANRAAAAEAAAETEAPAASPETVEPVD